MRIGRLATLIVAATAIAAAGVYLTQRLGWWASNFDTLRARYAQAPSRFEVVDGVPLHIRDEGSGPVVVMLHGSILNLHEWDLVAERLQAQFRVVRLDWPPYGLSGPDPTGEYSNARAAQLLEGVITKLGLTTFMVVATSNGGNVALEYYQQHPEHVQAMAFSILPLERPSQTRKVDWRIKWLNKFHQVFLPEYHSKFFYRLVLEDTTPASFTPPDELVQMMYDLDNLPGAARRQKQYIDGNIRLFATSDVGASAAGVRVPVLLQWCGYDTVISQSAQKTVVRFTQAPVELIEYPDLGHFPMWEDPARFSADLARFLRRVSAAAPGG